LKVAAKGKVKADYTHAKPVATTGTRPWIALGPVEQLHSDYLLTKLTPQSHHPSTMAEPLSDLPV